MAVAVSHVCSHQLPIGLPATYILIVFLSICKCWIHLASAERGPPGCRLWEIPFAAPQLLYAAPVLVDNKKTAVVQALGTPSKAPQSWFTWPAQGCLWTPLRCPC